MACVRLSKRDVQSRIEWFLDLKPCDFRRQLVKCYLKDIRRYSRSSKCSIRVKFQPSKQTPESVTVLTQFAGSSIDVLRSSIQDLGDVEVLDSNNFFDIVWCGTSDIPNVSLENRFVNKFPGAAAVFSKINLFRALELHRRLAPNIYSFYPSTWFLPFQKQALQLDADSTTAYRSENVDATKPTYIVKPDSGTQGRGIYLFQSPQSYIPPGALTSDSEVRTLPHQIIRPSSAVDVDASDVRSQNLNGLQPALDVVQRYEPNPVLLYGCKTDLRVYALIESLIPLKIHVYRDGLVRLASRLYHKPEQSNLCKHTMHLTNYAVNKLQHPPVCEATTNWPSVEVRDEVKRDTSNPPKWRCKQSLRELLQPLEHRKGTDTARRRFTWNHVDPVKLWSQIDEVICLTLFTLVPQLKVAYWTEYGHTLDRPVTAVRTKMRGNIERTSHTTQPPHCFQILGFDFLLVEPDFRPVLLEVNSNPSLRTDAMHHFIHRIPVDAKSAEYIILQPTHSLASKRFGRVFNPSGPVAETAAVLSSVLGDRYVEFERSIVDEHVKGGLIQSTLRLMTARVRENRKNVHYTSVNLPLNNANQGQPASHSKPDGLHFPVLQTSSGLNHRVGAQHYKTCNAISSSDVLLPNTGSQYSSPTHTPPTRLSSSLKIDKSVTEMRTPSGLTKELEQAPDSSQRYTSERLQDGNENSNALRSISHAKLPRLQPRIGQAQCGSRGHGLSREAERNNTRPLTKPIKASSTLLNVRASTKLDLMTRIQNQIYDTPSVVSPSRATAGVPLPDNEDSVTCQAHSSPTSRSQISDPGDKNPSDWPRTVVSHDAPSSPKEVTMEHVSLPDYAALECIYAEGDGFKAFTNQTTAESDLCENEHRRLYDKLRETQLKVQAKLPNPSEREYSRNNAPPLVLSLNLDAFDSAARVLDLLSDLFLSVLNSRRPQLKLFSATKDSVQVTDDWTSSATTMGDSRTGHPTRQRFVPRMDLTSFRAFCRRCRLNRLGLSFTELDLIFAKHRNWWQRVYEPELLGQARQVCHLRGLSFAAFVDLCAQLADHCCYDLGEKGIRTAPSTLHLPEIPLFPKPMPYVTSKLRQCSTLDLSDQKSLNHGSRLKPARGCRKSDTSHCSLPKTVDVPFGGVKLKLQFVSNESRIPTSDIHISNIVSTIRSSSLLNILHFIEHCCIDSLYTQDF